MTHNLRSPVHDWHSNLLLMPVETVTGDRQYYRLFYLQRLAQPRAEAGSVPRWPSYVIYVQTGKEKFDPFPPHSSCCFHGDSVLHAQDYGTPEYVYVEAKFWHESP
ncbi:hypothetical protein PAMA_017559 [Pampus argenteus]